MNLNKLSEFMSQKRSEFEEVVQEKAKDISLNEVISQINFSPYSFAQKNFEQGQKLSFLICQGHYSVLVDSKKLSLYGNCNINLKTFFGEEITDYYNSLCLEIKKEQEKDLPF